MENLLEKVWYVSSGDAVCMLCIIHEKTLLDKMQDELGEGMKKSDEIVVFVTKVKKPVDEGENFGKFGS